MESTRTGFANQSVTHYGTRSSANVNQELENRLIFHETRRALFFALLHRVKPSVLSFDFQRFFVY